jgi:hypothetical protein
LSHGAINSSWQSRIAVLSVRSSASDIAVVPWRDTKS